MIKGDRKEVTLRKPAPEVSQYSELALVFNTLGDDGHPKRLGQQVRNQPTKGSSLFLLDFLQILQNGVVNIYGSSHDVLMITGYASDVKNNL